MSVVQTPSAFNSENTPENPEKSKIIDAYKSATSFVYTKFFSKIKHSDFKRICPEIHKHDPEFLEDFSNQFSSQLRSNIEKDLSDLYKDQHLDMKLLETEQLRKEAASLPKDHEAWRPSGDPNEDMIDHKWELKRKHKEALEIILQSMSSQNDEMEEDIVRTHQEVLDLRDDVLKKQTEIQTKLNASGSFDVKMIEDLQEMIEEL